MKTTIELPDEILKKAKLKALENGISLKEVFISALEKELSASFSPKKESTPWKTLLSTGSVVSNLEESSGFDSYLIDSQINYSSLNEPKIT